MIAPKTIEVSGKSYIISKLPTTVAREILVRYPTSVLHILHNSENYKFNEELMFKLMSYVGVVQSGNPSPLMLSSSAVIDNHVLDEEGHPSAEALMKLEFQMMEYNFGFLKRGRILALLEDIAQKVPVWIIRMLTRLLAQYSQTDKLP